MENVYIMEWSFRSEVHGSYFSNIYAVEKFFLFCNRKMWGNVFSVL